jgi:RNA polymerase sigma-70 factor (ECF subfamily)
VLPDIPESVEAGGDPLHSMEAGELRDRLHRAIDALESRYRMLIVLRYTQDLSYEEIAALLNLPLGTVKTGLYRAKQKLRAVLDSPPLEESWTTP